MFFCDCTEDGPGPTVMDLVRNPEDRFHCYEAHLKLTLFTATKLSTQKAAATPQKASSKTKANIVFFYLYT